MLPTDAHDNDAVNADREDDNPPSGQDHESYQGRHREPRSDSSGVRPPHP